MANGLRRAWDNFQIGVGAKAPEVRDIFPISWQDGVDQMMMTYAGNQYLVQPTTTMKGRAEDVGRGFEGLVQYAYQNSGVVFAVELARIMLFSQARFKWQNKNTEKLSSTSDLAPLEVPWPGAHTTDLLAGMIQDADFSGNAFVRRLAGGRLERLRPDWITIVSGVPTGSPYAGTSVGSAWDPGSEVIGYLYHVGGRLTNSDPVVLDVDEVAHFAPIPDPVARWRGMGWLTPVLREIKGDTAAERHKLAFYENAATVNLQVVFDANTTFDVAQKWIEKFEEGHTGSLNAFKTLFMGAGAEAKPLGLDFRQMDYEAIQSAGENRICMAAGVPAIIAGATKGLDAGTYANAGFFRRLFGDRMSAVWANACAALERIVPPPAGYRLWFDASGIPFLREDTKDQASVVLVQAQAMRFLVDAGFRPDTVVPSVQTGDWSLLVHTGLYSVQLQPPGTVNPGAVAGGGNVPTSQTNPLPNAIPAPNGQKSIDPTDLDAIVKMAAEHLS